MRKLDVSKINNCFFITIVLLISVTAQNVYWFSYNQNKQLLTECIEDHFFRFNHFLNNEEIRKIKTTASMVSREFYGKSYSRRHFHRVVDSYFRKLKKTEPRSVENCFTGVILEQLIKEALVQCADDGPSNLITDTSFLNVEPHEIAVVLDYILVDWYSSLRKMISKKYGRELFRRFTHEAYPALVRAMAPFTNFEQLRVVLREYWMRRAQLFYDGRDVNFPYIRHRYTVNDGFQMFGDVEKILSNRTAQPFEDRNPRVIQLVVDNFLLVHVADRPPFVHHDIYAEYEKNGMTSAECYLESHIDQFMKVISFIRESQAAGILTAAEDTYIQSLIPYNILPSELQEIIYDSVAYQKYLLKSRLLSQGLIDDFFNVEKRLSNSTATPPLDVNNGIIAVNGTAPNCSESKRKGSVHRNSKGKHFPKRLRTASPNEDQQQMNMSYGYITVNYDSMVEEIPGSFHPLDPNVVESVLMSLEDIPHEFKPL